MLGGMMLASCSDIDNQIYEGGALSQEQQQEVISAIPERTEAAFNGIFSFLAHPCQNYGTRFSSARADDLGFLMMAIPQDLEGADLTGADSGYNWFSTARD